MRLRTLSPYAPPTDPRRAPVLARQSVAAALASGMIAASGRAHTPAEAVGVFLAVLAELPAPVPSGAARA